MPNEISKHSSILLGIMASIIILGSGMHAAYAQTLTVQTDRPSYATGDIIVVTGKLTVTATPIDEPLLIVVKDPQGGVVRSDPFNAAADGSYSYQFTTGGTMRLDGTYTVEVSYKGTTKQTTTFTFDATEEPGTGWREIDAMIGGQPHKIEYMITGGRVVSITGDVDTATLLVTLSTTSDGTLSLRFNEEIFDADDFFAAFADGIPTYEELSAGPGATNEIHIDFEQGTEEIEIVGDRIIPEFGAIAAIVLAVAIVGIIVATARYGKLNSFVKKAW